MSDRYREGVRERGRRERKRGGENKKGGERVGAKETEREKGREAGGNDREKLGRGGESRKEGR